MVLPRRRSLDGKKVFELYVLSGSDYFDRGLNKVYMNGTLVDPEFLKDERAWHCVFEEPGVDDGSDKSKGRIMAEGEDKGHRFGMCVLDLCHVAVQLECDVLNKIEDVDEANIVQRFFLRFLDISYSSRSMPSDCFLRYIVGHYAGASQDGPSQWVSVDRSQTCRRVLPVTRFD